jgi:hypothetical protein
MSQIDILDLLPDDDDAQESTGPDWTQRDPLADKAYNVMLSLKEERQKYIKTNRKKSAFTLKSAYSLSKTEVAKACEKSHANMIFKSNPLFAKEALRLFNDINLALTEQKEARLNTVASNGLQSRSKSELKTEAQMRGDKIKQLEAQLAKNVIDTLQETLPLDVKKKLKI